MVLMGPVWLALFNNIAFLIFENIFKLRKYPSISNKWALGSLDKNWKTLNFFFRNFPACWKYVGTWHTFLYIKMWENKMKQFS